MATYGIEKGILRVHNMLDDNPALVMNYDVGIFGLSESKLNKTIEAAWRHCQIRFEIADEATREARLRLSRERNFFVHHNPERVRVSLTLPAKAISHMLNFVTINARKHLKNVENNNASLISLLAREDGEDASSYMYSMMDNQIKADGLLAVGEALTNLLEGKTKNAYFTETSNMYKCISSALTYLTQNQDVSEKPFEVKYQYTGLLLSKNTVDDVEHAVNTHNILTSTYLHGTWDYTNAIEIILLQPSSSNNKEISLKQLYPALHNDVKNNRKRYTDIKICIDSVRFEYDYMREAWLKFNEMKCSLMLMGYPEEKVVRFLSWAIFNSPGKRKIAPRQCYEKCQITDQFIPNIFSVPVKKSNGNLINANIYYITTYNDNLRRNLPLLRYSPDNETKIWVERDLEPAHYHVTNKCAHNFNVLDFLSPRSSKGENIKIYDTNRGYRPTPYLGVELEVERNEGCIENITEPVLESLGRDFVILKHDGSLRGYNPFEIVTIPATLEYHKQRWMNFMEDTKLKQNLMSFKSGSCGVHVHISRNSFTGLHLAKFMRFINMAENHKFITKIAQRGNVQYSRYSDRSLMNSAKIIRRGGGHEYHYEAVNTQNAATIEVRIFRGNLGKTAFFKNLEFVHAVWAYTQNCSMKALNYKDFLVWLFDNKKDHHRLYANLEKWLIATGYNISSINISKESTPEEKIKLLAERKRRKKMQLVVSRRFKPTETNIGKEAITDVLASA